MAVVGLAFSGCGVPDGKTCGADGSNSSNSVDGSCNCDSGFTWESFDDANNYNCVEIKSGGGTTACTPDCQDRDCGDDGCGGTCGDCASGFACSSAGQCFRCDPACAGNQCGDDGCGGTCGDCAASQTCNSGQCIGCAPDCTNKSCGDDGCGGSCGTCNSGTCDSAGQCQGCTPACGGNVCGNDGCGGSCGTCAAGSACNASGQCYACTPQCNGKQCGPDACGGRCGTCTGGASCDGTGQCYTCTPQCGGLECGDNGCGGQCGTCPTDTFCNNVGRCQSSTCTPDCNGRVCGPDPVCGESCGNCGTNETCTSNYCVPNTGSPVGGPCAVASDCEGATATCATDADGFPGGFCIVNDCAGAGGPCPAGSTCFYTDADQTQSACFPDCTSASDCRSGYECDEYDTCWPGSGGTGGTGGTGGSGGSGGSGGTGGTVPVGGPCVTNVDCNGGECIPESQGFPGGYCVLNGCASGSGCPSGSTCYYTSSDQTESACFPNCSVQSDCRTGYYCDSYNNCWPGEPACTTGSCPTGQFCSTAGQCVENAVGMPAGPVPDCSAIADWQCSGNESYCGEIVPFEPDLGPGYWDYPLNGETTTNQYRSYCRRDLMLMVKHAAAYTDCVSAAWSFGNVGEPLGLGDMSEANGDIPGTSINDPGHPVGTHVNGFDMDIAYFQTGTADNTLRPVCNHYQGGQEAYHCTGPPDLMDGWRTAVFIGMLHASPQLRVIGVDGQVGPDIETKVAQLCNAGWIAGDACGGLSLAYEVTDTGMGWYLFHHHHLHMSIVNRPAVGWMTGAEIVPFLNSPCLRADCAVIEDMDRQLVLDLNRPFLLERRIVQRFGAVP